jgi:hypothetical protein
LSALLFLFLLLISALPKSSSLLSSPISLSIFMSFLFCHIARLLVLAASDCAAAASATACCLRSSCEWQDLLKANKKQEET